MGTISWAKSIGSAAQSDISGRPPMRLATINRRRNRIKCVEWTKVVGFSVANCQFHIKHFATSVNSRIVENRPGLLMVGHGTRSKVGTAQFLKLVARARAGAA